MNLKVLGDKDILKSNKIINSFQKTQKTIHLFLFFLSFSYFQKLMIYHNLMIKIKEIITITWINPFFVDSYRSAKNYLKKLFYIFKYFKEYDQKLRY